MPEAAANPAQGGELPVTESPQQKRESFRERAASRLRSERTGEEPSRQPAPRSTKDTSQRVNVETARRPEKPATGGVEEPTEETEEGQLDESELDTETEGSTETADDESQESEPEEGTVEFYQRKLEKAEEARKNFERDYRLKTHQFGALRRELTEQMQQAQGQTAYLVGLAEQEVRKFAGINWDLERVQNPPQVFEQRKQAYANAVANHQRLSNAFGQLQQRHADYLDSVRKREIEISKETLKTFIPGWSKDKYLAIRELANQEALYTPEEFEKLTDWRPVYMLHRIQELEGKPKTPADVKLQRKQRHKPGSAQNTSLRRNVDGKFTSAREAAFAKPGNRLSFREMKIAQLAKERARRA